MTPCSKPYVEEATPRASFTVEIVLGMANFRPFPSVSSFGQPLKIVDRIDLGGGDLLLRSDDADFLVEAEFGLLPGILSVEAGRVRFWDAVEASDTQVARREGERRGEAILEWMRAPDSDEGITTYAQARRAALLRRVVEDASTSLGAGDVAARIGMMTVIGMSLTGAV